MLPAVFQITLFFGRNGVVIPRTGQYGYFHAGFYASLQVDVFIQRYIRPIIHQLNHLVTATDTVNSSETLDNADGIPMDVVVYQVIAILQVLTFTDAIGSNQDVYLFLDMRIDACLLLGTWREQGQHFIEAIDFPVAKCLIVGEATRLAELEKKMYEVLKDRMGVYRSEPYFLELVPKGIDKAQSLAVLLEKIGATKDEMLVAMDSTTCP